jgi:Holliday junction resolvasome RuvABC endonuclease subunit
MSLVLGIDQSLLHTGICVCDVDLAGQLHAPLVWELVEPGKKVLDTERLAYIRDRVREVLRKYSISIAVMEGYSYNSVGKKFELGECGGVLKLELFDKGIPLHIATPAQLKKFVTGKGDATKERVMGAILQQWGWPVSDDNLADACGLAAIGAEIYMPASRKRHQLEVVKIIINSDLKKEKRKGIKVPKDSI